MSFFPKENPERDAEIEKNNRIASFINHSIYSKFNDRISRGGMIFEEELDILVIKMHKDLCTVTDITRTAVHKLSTKYIMNEWGWHGVFHGKKQTKNKEPKPVSKPTANALDQLMNKFNQK